MKKMMAVVLTLALALSFVVGILISRAEASCVNQCRYCPDCHLLRCCNGVCTDTGKLCGSFCRFVDCNPP